MKSRSLGISSNPVMPALHKLFASRPERTLKYVNPLLLPSPSVPAILFSVINRSYVISAYEKLRSTVKFNIIDLAKRKASKNLYVISISTPLLKLYSVVKSSNSPLSLAKSLLY